MRETISSPSEHISDELAPASADGTSSWKEALREAAWIFSLSRLLFLIITFVGVSQFIQYNRQNVPIPPKECALDVLYCLRSWNAWDFNIFIGIAQSGFSQKPELSALFPLWPLMMRLAVFFHPTPTALFFSGMALANLCFLAMMIILYRLVQTQFSADVARNTLLLLAFNPYAVFFFVGYNESFFLLLCVSMFFFLLRGHPLDWWLAGLCGAAMMLTRGTSIVLGVPFLVALIQRFWPLRHEWRTHWRPLLNAALPICLIPLALALYMFYLYRTQNNPFAFSTWEAKIWGRHLDFPWSGFIETAKITFINQGRIDANLRDLIFSLVPLIILVIGWKHIPWLYRSFAATMMLFSLSYPVTGKGHPLVGMPRFLMVIFPLFIICALWSNKYPRLKIILLGISLTMLTLDALIFLVHLRLA